MKLKDLMKQGDDLFERHQFPREPDWEALYSETPDDTEVGEGPYEEDRDDEINAAVGRTTREAIAEDLQDIGRELERIALLDDSESIAAELSALSDRLPELLGDADALSLELAERMVAAFSDPDPETDPEDLAE